MSAAQYAHEPLAELYGCLRSSADADSGVRGLMRRHVLVVDWGGGTLDLTLCRIEPGRILQLRNGGTQQVGGDKFDQVIRDEVVTRFSNNNGIAKTDHPTREARLRLLQDSAPNNIDLSDPPRATSSRPHSF